MPERLSERVLRCGEHRAEQVGGKPGPAEHGSPDGGHDVPGGAVLGNEARCARPDGVGSCPEVGVGRQHHHYRRHRQCHQLSCELEAVAVAEVDIHDHDVGRVRPHGFDHLVRIGDGRHGLEIRLGPEQHAESLGKEPMIIDDDQPGRAHMPTARCSRCQLPVSTSPSLTA